MALKEMEKLAYKKALEDVEKIGKSESPANIKPNDNYFIFISQETWDKLKAKGE